MKELSQTANDIRRLRAMRKGWETIFHESKPGSERDTAFNMIQLLDDAIFSHEYDLEEGHDEYAH